MLERVCFGKAISAAEQHAKISGSAQGNYV
jgi:hypothetical protein